MCYLQILLADALHGVGRERLMQDMDEWGYSFRLGSTRAWFERTQRMRRSGCVATASHASPRLPDRRAALLNRPAPQPGGEPRACR